MKKNIAHLTFDMRIGGAEQVIMNLAEHTDKSRYAVQILCLDPHIGPFGQQMQRKGIAVTSLNRQPGFDLSLIKSIRRFFRLQKIDVAHCHQYTPYVYGVLAAIGTNTKIIFTEHGRFYPDIRKLKRVLVNPLLSVLTSNITAISQATKQALVEFENFPAQKIEVIYNGIDDKRFAQPVQPDLKKVLGIPESSRILGTIARLDPIKNQPMMLRALKIVHAIFPDVYLILVGDGPEREKTEKLARELGIESRVIFTGFREDTHNFYHIFDLFLLTSFSEGTAMTLLEAMACGIPCIATEVGGNPEIVAHGVSGIIVPSDDHEGLAGKIVSLFRNTKEMGELGKKGRMRFEKLFSIQKMISSYQQHYGNGQ